MKKIYLLVLLCLTTVVSFALNGPSTPAGPGTGFSGTTTYCVGASASPITYNYSECSIGVGPATGVACEATWYYNTTNTNVVSGSTVLVSGPIAFTSEPGTNGDLPPVTPVTTASGTYYYFCVVTWTEPGTCSSPFVTSTLPVTIHATPATIGGAATVCVGSNITLSNSTGGGTWTSGDLSVATVGSTSGVVTGAGSGTVNITYTITSTGCTAVRTLTVDPLPAAITGTQTMCLGSGTVLSSATAGGNWTSSNGSVATVNSSGVVTSVGAGTATISYTLGTGCTRTAVVTVYPTPGAITGTTSVCTGLTTTLFNSTSGGTWTSGDASIAVISGSGVVTPVSAGTVDITYSLATGCFTTTTVTVNSSPAAITGTTVVCTGQTSTLGNASSGGIWSTSGPTVAAVDFSTGVVTGVSSGTAFITYTLGSGCRTVTNVTVNSSPSTISGSRNVCIGFTTTLGNSITGGVWTSSNTGVATVGAGTGVVTSVTTGTTNITYELSTGCFATAAVTVNPLPSAITGTGVVCIGATTTLGNPDAGGTWAVAGASIASIGSASGIVTGNSAGTTTVTYTLPTGCRTTTVITVNSLPAVITGTASLCIGATTTLASATSGGAWSSSDGSVAAVSSTGVVSGLSAGTSTITYTGSNGCSRTATVTVNVLPAAITGSLEFCLGSYSTLSNATAGGTWISAQPSEAPIGASTGIVYGNAAGNTTISYRLSTGCATTAELTINPLPGTILGSGNMCVGNSTTFTQSTTGGTWSTSDATIGTVTSAGVVTAVSTGVFNTSYTLSTGCYRFVTTTVSAVPAAITGAGTVCPGTTLTLSNATGGGSWVSSSSSTATVGSATGIVTGNAAGVVTISYVLSSGCFSATTVTVEALPPAISGLPSVCIGSTVTLSNSTAGGTWSISDASLATISATGVVTGLSTGVPEVTYTLGTGCFRTRAISVNPVPAAITGTMLFCAGSTSLLSNATSGGTWTSSSPTIASVNATSGLVTGNNGGTATITYSLSTGCRSTAVVSIDPLPAAISGSSNVCVGSTIALSSTTAGGAWSSSDGSIASVSATGVVTGNAAGVATISYTLGTGCYRAVNITVNPLPAAITGTLVACVGNSTTLANATSGGLWSSGSPSVATIGATTGAVTGVSGGTANITYTLSTSCISVATVTINPLPATLSGTATVCVGATTTFASATAGGAWSTSDASVANVDAAGVVSGLSAGNATITYTLGTGCLRTRSVTVNSLPAAITGTGVVCAGSTTVLASATSGGTFSSGSTTIATVGAGTGIVTGVAAGTATITYSISSGCFVTSVVTVEPLPAVLTGAASVCIGSTTVLSSTTGGGTWATSDASIAGVTATGVVSGVSAGTAVITYTLSTGCYRTAVVTVNNLPAAIGGASSVCVGSATTFTNATSGGTWSSGDITIATVGASTGVVTGASAGVVDITYTITATGCRAIATITVDALPAAITGSGSVCVGATTLLSNTTGGGTWASSNAGVATITAGGTVTGVAPGTATITYTLGTGCIRTRVITVNALPASIGGTAAVCIGSASTLTNATSGGTWLSGDVTIATVGSSNGIITGVAAGNTDVTYTVTATGCTSVITVTVNPLPAAITGTAVTCIGSSTGLASATAGGTWASGNTARATVSATGVVTGVSAGTAVITYTLGTGCFRTVTVTVNALPPAIAGTATVCEGANTTFTNSASGGTWSSGDGTVASIGATTGVITGILAGTSEITYTAGTGCIATRVVTVNVAPAAITGTMVMCAGSSSTLANAVAGGLWSSSNTSVASINVTTGVLNGNNGGNATISYTLGNGCRRTAVVTINPSPAAITGTSSVCVGSVTTMFNSVSGGTWASSDGSIATIGVSTGVVTGISAGTVDITYMLAAGCFSTRTVTVNALPAAITGTASICVGNTTTLANATVGGSWTSSPASVATIGSGSGIVTGNSAGVANVTYTLPTGCRTISSVTVNAVPVSIVGSTSMCVGGSVTLTNLTAGGTWTSSDAPVAGVGASTGIVTGASAGTATISYSLASGCYRSVVVTVYAVPSAITGTPVVCVAATTTLANAVTGGTWSSSLGSVATVGLTTGVVTGNTAGTATITYSLAGGCRTTTVVTVNPLPAAISGAAAVCDGSSTLFTTTTAGGTWTSSDPTIASVLPATGAVTGEDPGTAVISYTLGTGCYRTRTITVNPLPAAITGTTVICAGTSTALGSATTGGTWASSAGSVASIVATTGVLTGNTAGTATITYTLPTGCITTTVVTVNGLPASITGTPVVCVGLNTTLSNATTGGTWSSGAGTIASVDATTGVVSGVAPGTAVISYTLATGCFTTRTVTVNPLPAAIGGTASVCAGSTTTLTNATTGGNWTSSATGVAVVAASSGVVTGVTAGTATITYTISTGCIATTVVTVNALPSTITGTPRACIGSTATLANATAGGAWSSSNSNATVDAAGVVTGVSVGTAVITYQLGTGCFRVTTFTVNPLPAAIAGASDVCVGSTITLTNATAGGTWSSSVPATASINSFGVLTGAGAGVVNVTYTLATGCFTTTPVTVNPLPASVTGTASVCVGLTTTLASATAGGTWTSGSANATIDATTGVVTGALPGTAVITYTLSTGCFTTRTVTVNALPGVVSGSLNVCVGSTTNLSSSPAGGTWSTGDAAVATVASASGVVTGVAAGTADIVYTLSTGCTRTVTVTVNPLPAAITGTLAVCMGSTTTLANATAGGTWSSSSLGVAAIDVTSGVVTPAASGTATITYTLATGCVRTAVVTVNALPTAISGSLSVCVGLTSNLSSTPSGGTWSSSNMTAATVGTSSGVVFGLAIGTSTITYTLGTGCIRTAEVTVNESPAAITGASNVCVGSTTVLANAVAGGLWTSSNAAVASIDPFGAVTGEATGVATITYTLGSGCRTTRNITVSPLPAVITGTMLVCEGSTTVLSSATIGGTWSSSNALTASVGTGSGVVTGVAAGTATITYTSAAGCIRTAVVTVNITPAAIGGTLVICSGQTTSLTNAVAGGVWYTAASTIASVDASTGVATGLGAGIANITYTVSTGCSRVASLTVNATPSTISGSPIVCEGATTNLTVSPAGGTWASSNTGVAIVSATGVVSGVVAGTSIISYSLSTGCSRSVTVTVNPAPAAITGTGVVCAGQQTTLSNASVGGAWNSSNVSIASIDASGVVSGNAAGTAIITYTLGSGCSRTTIVTVNPAPSPLTGVAYVCEGATTLLSSSPAGGNWSSSDPSVAVVSATGLVTGSVAGTTNITYTLSSGCFSFTTVTVNVNPPAITGASTVCVGSSATLANALTGGNWTSSNTSILTAGFSTGVVTGVAAGTATVTYTLTSGCRTTSVISVNGLPAAIGGIPSLCIGSVGTLTNATAGGLWTSSDGAVVSIGSGTGFITGLSTGTSIISYTVASGCARTVIVTVNPLPSAISGTMSVCVGSSTFLTSATTGGTWSSGTPSVATIGSTTGIVNGITAGTSNITYTLSTGCRTFAVLTVDPIPAAIAGSPTVCVGTTTVLSNSTFGGTWSSANPAIATIDVSGVVTGEASGIATISYAVSTGCARTINVTVNPGPSAITGTTGICIGSSTTLFNATAGGSWSSSNTGVANVGLTSGVVTSVAPGTATISYTVSTGCRQTVVVTVHPLPSTISGSTVICTGSTSTLTNAVTGGTWSTSTSAVATVDVTTGVVTAVAPGTATITYSLGSGCRATTVVSVNTIPAAISGITNVCEGATVTLSNPTPGGIWSSSNVTIATISATGVVNGIAAGTVTISYTMSSGCARTATVTVNPIPGEITGFTSICLGQTASLSNAIGGGVWNSSNPAIASVGVTTGVVEGLSSGSVNITYTLGTGCRTWTGFTVNALPTPIGGSGIVCEGLTTTLTNSIAGGTWVSVDPSVATIGLTTGIVTGISAGYDTVYYIVGGSCSSFTVLTVNPTPTIEPAGIEICVGASDLFTSPIGGGTWTSSNPSVATIGLSSGVVNGISAGSAFATYTLGAGCYTIASIAVNTQPAAITGIANVCSGQSTTLFNSIPGGIWASNNVSVASIASGSGVVTGGASGSTVITYTLPGGCYSTTVVTVNPAPAPITVVGSLTAPLQVCAGATLSLSNVTGGGIWSSTNPSVAPIGLSTGVVAGVNVGTTSISYTILSTGCSRSQVLTVNPLPEPITGIMTVCEGATTTLSSASISGTWESSNFAVASVGISTGIVSGFTPGLATITYELPTGCYRTADIGVNPIPAAITGTPVVCENSTVTLSNATAFGTWSSSNTAVATAGSVTGAITGIAEGTATITYMMGTGCYVTQQLTVNAVPAALVGDPFVCEGSAIYLSSTTAGGTWNSSNPSVATVDAMGNVFGVVTGTSAVSYVLGTGCMAVAVVTVEPTPAAITGVTNVCAGSTTTLGNTFLGGVWSSSNTSVATVGSSSGIVTGVAGGTATITYASPVAGCFVTTVVSVTPLPAAIIGLTEVCIGSNITLSNATLTGTWSSSNIAVATIDPATGIVTGVAANTVIISYTVATGCAATSTITVNPLAFADTITGPTAVCLGSSITLGNSVAGGTWISSDTTILKVDTTTGVATGFGAGTAIVTYTVINSCGTATATRAIVVNPLASAGTISGSTATCIGYTTTLGSTVTGGTWAISDTAIATVTATGVVTGKVSGTVTVSYTVTTICGTATATVNVTVHGLAPLASITIHPDSNMCSNINYQNFGTATGQPTGVTYMWTAVNAEVNAMSADRKNAIISFPTAGTAIVKLTTNVLASGCTMTDSFVANIGTTVAHNPEVQYYNELLICNDNSVDSYQWGYDDVTTLDSTIIRGATNQDYYLPVPDFATRNYWVMTMKNGCLQKSYYNVPVNTPGLTIDTDIKMFPNPADSRINIMISGLPGTSDVDVKVFDMLGKAVYNGALINGKGTIDVAQLPSGVYSVQFVQDGKKIGSRNFVKQ